VPDLSSFPRHSWLRALRQGLSSIESQSLGYVSSKGLPDARTAVSDYLRRTRGVRADPQRVVLCSGATQAVALLAHVVGDRAVAMENPGFWLHRMVFRHHGIEPLPVPVDDDGLDVAALANTAASAVLTTPAHQSPTGVVLSPARRTALLEWARAGNIVIEDDYDAEYRYDRAPVGALHALAPDRVVYLGSVSKTLAPGLRLGWMVLPPDLVGPVVSAKSLADTGSSVMDQLAFATLLRSGDYDRHLRLMRRAIWPDATHYSQRSVGTSPRRRCSAPPPASISQCACPPTATSTTSSARPRAGGYVSIRCPGAIPNPTVRHRD